MYKLHSCRVTGRKDGRVHLESINNRHTFTLREGGDDDWEIIT